MEEYASGFRLTVATARVLRVFLDDASQPRYGYDLMEATGFPSGKIYPILARLTRAGWLTREREQIDPSEAGRPVRYLYCLTAHGKEAARYELAVLSQQIALPPPPMRRLRPEGGRS